MIDQVLIEVPDGASKTELVRAYALDGAMHPTIRQTATRLVQSVSRYDHRERLARLHRFVRDSVPYFREPIEMLHPAAMVLTEGGDCDDHVILLGALAWSLRYPFIVEPIGDPNAPSHYTIRLGSPPDESPHGDARTTWHQAETTIPAAFGESLDDAAQRMPRLLK